MSLEQCQKTIGENLKKARKDAGLRQVDVEEKAGVAYRHYQAIETGRVNLTLQTLLRLAQLFGVRLTKLVRGTGC